MPSREVLYFRAEWCAPCRAVSSQVKTLAAQHAAVKFETVDIDESPVRAQQYGVRSVPTLLLLEDGLPAMQYGGSTAARDLAKHLST